MHNRKWFTVGKKIKRGVLPCPCRDCSKPAEFIIQDEFHADNLYMASHELNIKYYEC